MGPHEHACGPSARRLPLGAEHQCPKAQLRADGRADRARSNAGGSVKGCDPVEERVGPEDSSRAQTRPVGFWLANSVVAWGNAASHS
jgi:hypothetical protein